MKKRAAWCRTEIPPHGTPTAVGRHRIGGGFVNGSSCVAVATMGLAFAWVRICQHRFGGPRD